MCLNNFIKLFYLESVELHKICTRFFYIKNTYSIFFFFENVRTLMFYYQQAYYICYIIILYF